MKLGGKGGRKEDGKGIGNREWKEEGGIRWRIERGVEESSIRNCIFDILELFSYLCHNERHN